MKDKYKRLRALLLAGTIAITGSTLSGCAESNNSIPNENPAVLALDTTKHFDIGEHIISVPINRNITSSVCQFEYHPGYEPIGISATAHGDGFDFWGGGAILYSNVEEVDCTASKTDRNGNVSYLDFGTPTYTSVDTNDTDNDIKDFGIGEHILSVPFSKDNRNNNIQYDFHEGYEVVGIATAAHGDGFNFFSGGALLYKNVVPVRCVRSDKGYITFGTPIENEKTKVYD